MKSYRSSGVKAALLFFFCCSLASLNQAFAQVSIAPTSLFFDNQSRVSSLTVSNGGQQAQEISISTEFGFPTSENGDLVISDDSVLAQQKSMADWIKIFPQSFTLEPQQRQTVRFVSQPSSNVGSGGYWSRVKIKSNPVSTPVESVSDDEVGAQINLVVNQVIAAHYHAEEAKTEVEVTSVDFSQNKNNDSGQISISMEQTGNAPFIGSLGFSITNNDGETVYQTNTTNSVYTTITRSFDIDLTDWEAGEYTVSGTIASERRDISQDNLLQIKPISFQKQITIE